MLALGTFAAHTVLPNSGSVAHFFDYRLYNAIIAAGAALTIARAAVSPLHRGAWNALAAAVTSYARWPGKSVKSDLGLTSSR